MLCCVVLCCLSWLAGWIKISENIHHQPQSRVADENQQFGQKEVWLHQNNCTASYHYESIQQLTNHHDVESSHHITSDQKKKKEGLQHNQMRNCVHLNLFDVHASIVQKSTVARSCCCTKLQIIPFEWLVGLFPLIHDFILNNNKPIAGCKYNRTNNNLNWKLCLLSVKPYSNK